MAPRGFKRVDPAEKAKLLTAAKSILSVLVAGSPGNVDLMMAARCLENFERGLDVPEQAPAPLLDGEGQ